MKKIYHSVLFSLIFFSFLFFSAGDSYAASAATLTLNSVNNSSGQITAYGDPYSPVILHYGRSASQTASIGSTDQNGYLTMSIDTNGYQISCGFLAYVVVNGQQSQSIPWSMPNDTSCTTTTSSNTLSFSQNNIILTTGQTQTVTINGIGGYYISSNSNPVIGTTLNGNMLNLYSNAFGGSNITVCDSNNTCGTLYVVAVNNVPPAAINQSAPVSLTVSSNNASGQFIAMGSIITLSFSTNQSINSVSATVAGLNKNISGAGAGPYTFSYTITGNEVVPIPVVINFYDSASVAHQAAFALGSVPFPTAVAPAAPLPTPVVTTPAPLPSHIFSQFINAGAAGDEVIQLQERLMALGFYTGPVNGHFGPLTEAAVKKFQSAHSISQAGYLGPATRAALNQP